MTHMNRTKKILLFFVVFSTLIGLITWGLTKNVTQRVVKDLVNKELRAFTSQKSHINGEITWHFWPRPAIKITNIHIATINYTLSIENLLCHVRLTPLLHKRFVFKEIKIDGLTANIKNTSSPASFAEIESINNNNSMMQFAVRHFSLTRGAIVINQPQQIITLTNMELNADQLNLQHTFFPLKLKTRLAISTDKNIVKTNLDYNGKLRFPDLSTLDQPFAVIKNAGINGQLMARNLQINQFKISKLNAQVINKKGILTLNPLKMSLYSGESVGDINYQFTTKKLAINQIGSQIDANLFFNTLFGKTVIKGNLELSAHGAVILNENNWQDNISGSGSLTVKDGILDFIDLQALANNASKKIHSLSAESQDDLELTLEQPLTPKKNAGGTTNFQLLSLQYQLQKGRFISNSLLLQTNTIQLRGQGQVKLNNYALGGNLFATLVTSDAMLDKMQQLLGGSFPLVLSGTLTQPEISPNAREINPILTRYMLKNALIYPVKQITNQFENILLSPLLLTN